MDKSEFENSFCDDGSINVLEFIQSDESSMEEVVRTKTTKKRKPIKRKAKAGMKKTPMKRKRKPKPGTKRNFKAYLLIKRVGKYLLTSSIVPFLSRHASTTSVGLQYLFPRAEGSYHWS